MVKLGDCGTGGRVNVEGTMHEILHALGFYHENTRRDRNAFIRDAPRALFCRAGAGRQRSHQQ